MALLAKTSNLELVVIGPGPLPFISPASYGATFDGTHDDTEAWQTALNLLSNTENPPLLIAPAGVSKITNQLVLTGANHPKIIAPGCILKAGATLSGKAVLKIFNSGWAQIDGLSIDGNCVADYGMWCDADDTDPTTHRPERSGVTVQNLYQNLDIRNAVVEGVRIASNVTDPPPTGNVEVDTMHFSSCRFRGSPNNVGVHSGNSIRILFDGQSSFDRYSADDGTQYPPNYNIYVERGGVSLTGVTMAQALEFDIYLGTGSYLFVSDLYTESKKVLQTGFQGSYPYPILIQYLNQNVTSDDGDPVSIDWNFAGYLHLLDCKIGGNVALNFLAYGSSAERVNFSPNRGFTGAQAAKLSITDYRKQLISEPLVVSNAVRSYTDLVIDSSDNSRVTSAAQPFTSSDVGETLQITGGTGFTVEDVTIYAVDGSHVAYCTAALGAAGSTGGQAAIGGVEFALVNRNGYPASYPLNFYSYQYGPAIRLVAQIRAETTGEDITNGSKGDLVFSTKFAITDTALAERLRILSSGEVQLPDANKIGWKIVSSMDTWFQSTDVAKITTNSWLISSRPTSGDICFSAIVAGDANDRMFINANGDILFGDGTAVVDLKIYRIGVAAAAINGRLFLVQPGGSDTFLDLLVSGETQSRIYMTGGPEIWMGPGGATPQDIRLYRSGTSELSLDNHVKLTGSYILTAAGPADGIAINIPNRRSITWGSGAFLIELTDSSFAIGVAGATALHFINGTQKVYAAADFQVIGNLQNNTGTLVDASGNASFVSLKIGGSSVIDSSRNGALASLTLTTALDIPNGGTGAANATNARTNLSVYSQAQVDAALAGKADITSITGTTLTLAKITTGGANGSLSLSSQGTVTAYTAPT